MKIETNPLDCERGRRAVTLLVWLILWMGSLSTAWAQQRPATLITLRDTTVVRRSLQGPPITPVVRGLGLSAGNVVRTDPGGMAEALFRDGRHVKMAQSTTLEISPAQADRMRVLSGKVWVRVPPRTGLQIDGLAANCHITGTELQLEVAADGTTTLTVVEGEVRFENPVGSVSVQGSQQSVARPGQAPTVPTTVNVPFLIEWTNDLQPAVLLLEITFVSPDPARLSRAEAEAARLSAGPARSLALGDVRHDRGDPLGALAEYDLAATALGPMAAPGERARIMARRGQALLELGRVPDATAAFRESIRLDATAVLPRLGLVMALLSRRELDTALTEAQAAVGVARDDAQAHLGLALVRIRRGERPQAAPDLDRALTLDPGQGQAHAWKAYLLRADGRLAEAESEARRAVALSPRSAVAQQSLADALFLQGRLPGARQAARQAVQLNPFSAAAQVALGQAELGLGNIDPAVRAAHRAVALDPDLERSRYFLGLALAQQRDLEGAERHLRRALELDPEMLEARTLLARVLTEQGHRSEALAVAREAVTRSPRSAAAHSAVGSILWRQGRLEEAAASYRTALSLAPGSVQAHLELARVYLDQNNLPDALAHALEAVHRAPSSGEAHALLGLVYERSANTEQALREYRQAVSLSPDNALARIGFAVLAPNVNDGFAEFPQALLRDPSVPQQLFKPGVTTELSAAGGTDDLFRQGFRHRDQYLEGRLHDYGFAFNQRDGGWRGNDDSLSRLLLHSLAARPTPRLTATYVLTHHTRKLGLPGLSFDPDPVSSDRSSRTWNTVAARYRTAATDVWVRAAYEVLREGHTDPNAPGNGRLRLGTDILQHVPSFELRLDHRLSRSNTLSYGYSTSNDFFRFEIRSWDVPGEGIEQATHRIRRKTDVHYSQLDHRTGRLSLMVGALHERLIERALVSHTGPVGSTSFRLNTPGDSRWLPYVASTLEVAPRTLVRLLVHERTSNQQAARLLPTEAFITGESARTAVGGRARTIELDLEQRFSPKFFAKLFFLRSHLRNLAIETPEYVSSPGVDFYVSHARIEGIGLRLERQLTPFLAGYLRWTNSRTTDRTQGPAFGLQLPQRSRNNLLLGLNFVDRAGTKLFLEGVYNSSVYAESLWPSSISTNPEGFDLLAPRPREPARLLLNLRVAQERSVRQEWIVQINNLLNRSYSLWPGLPGRGRTVSLELRRRF